MVCDDLRHVVAPFIVCRIAVPVSFGIAIFLTELSPAAEAPLWALRWNCWLRCRLYRVRHVGPGVRSHLFDFTQQQPPANL